MGSIAFKDLISGLWLRLRRLIVMLRVLHTTYISRCLCMIDNNNVASAVSLLGRWLLLCNVRAMATALYANVKQTEDCECSCRVMCIL